MSGKILSFRRPHKPAPPTQPPRAAAAPRILELDGGLELFTGGLVIISPDEQSYVIVLAPNERSSWALRALTIMKPFPGTVSLADLFVGSRAGDGWGERR